MGSDTVAILKFATPHYPACCFPLLAENTTPTMATRRIAAVIKWLLQYRAVIPARCFAEEIPNTGDREPQFRIWPRLDFSGDGVRCRKRSVRGGGSSREVFRFDAAAQQDAKAHPV